MNQKYVGLIPSDEIQLHFLDHLAVICHVLDAPLLLTKELEYTIASKYYPDVNIRFIPHEEVSSDYLVANFDVLILSDLWSKTAFHEKYGSLEKKYGKTLRHVHCPHGFSDKGYYLYKCAYEDILLVYGQNMLDLLKYFKVDQHLSNDVITGNYRYSYYKKHAAFYHEIINNEILAKFENNKPLILYAPTWQDSDQATSFFVMCSNILDQLPDGYNMVVKPHPRLEWDDPMQYYEILRKYNHKKNILFLNEFPLIYPLLEHTDIYIGDMSAIGYDYLVFNKPMFFLNTKKRDVINDRTFLYSCGVQIFPEEITEIFSIIANNLPTDKERFTQFRQALYSYTFGVERSFSEIKEEVNTAVEFSKF